jgi:hypothetical protein
MSQQESVLSRFRPLMDTAEPSRFPKVGELILVNFIVGAMDSGSLRSPLTGFTPSSGTKAEGEMTNSPHVCIAISVTHNADGWILMVFPTRSYSESDDSVQYVAEMSRHKRDLHIPASFGDPVDVNIVSRKHSWIVTEGREIMMGHKGWVRSVPIKPYEA